MHVSKIIVTKGLTKEDPQNKRWNRQEFIIEMILKEGEDPETAKAYAETLIDAWLKKES